MKRYILGGLAASALLTAAPLGAASAADMALKAPPPPPVMSWTGWYAGVNGGYSWGDWDSSSLAAIFPGGTGASPDVKGWFGGVQAGYNWQVSSQWVLGIEGDFDWSGERARDAYSATTSAPTVGFPAGIGACDVAPICTTTVTTTAANQWKLPWFGTLRGRAGVLVEPTWLLYGTAGLAFAGTKFSDASTTTTTITNGAGTIVNPATGAAGGAPTVVSSAFSETNNRVGVAVGAGVEKWLSPNWSVKAEYLFLDFGSHTFLTGTGFDTNIKLIDNIVRVGIDYHFAGPH